MSKSTGEFLNEYFGYQADLILEEGKKVYDLVIQDQVESKKNNRILRDIFAIGFAHGAAWMNEKPVSGLVDRDGNDMPSAGPVILDAKG